jgi:predicted RNase H-like HicB family nuclease
MRGLTMSRNNDIELEFDEETRNYYIVWEPIVISLGKTRQEALEDLRQAAHFGVDTLIDLKLKDIGKGEK